MPNKERLNIRKHRELMLNVDKRHKRNDNRYTNRKKSITARAVATVFVHRGADCLSGRLVEATRHVIQSKKGAPFQSFREEPPCRAVYDFD